MKQVKYIGRKQLRTDNIGGTKTVWFGHGDVQAVPDEAWEKLSQYPDVWVLATTVTPILADATVTDAQPAAADDLAAMNAAELREWAKANGKKIDGRLKDPDAIRAALTAE